MLNKVILMGRLTSDPELKTTQSGISVATFCVAVDRNYQSKDAEKQADFIPCVAWRQTADFISKFFSKGKMIALEGSLQSRNYEDKTGAKRTAYDVVVDQAYFGESKASSGQAQQTAPMQTKAAPARDIFGKIESAGFEVVGDDDGNLPF